MAAGFPITMIDHLACTVDGASLVLEHGSTGNRHAILSGSLACTKCSRAYRIREGIVEMLSATGPEDATSEHEMKVRDIEAGAWSREGEELDAIKDAMEVPSTLRRLGEGPTLRDHDILELGCGTGRYTGHLANDARSVLAVDFSRQSLAVNAQRLGEIRNVGLLHADISHLRLQPGRFDRALSTCYSNLPTREIREASTRTVHEALRKGGRYVLSAHHRHLVDFVRRVPSAQTYENGIYYRCFTSKELRDEMRAYFRRVRMETVCIWIPKLSRARTSRVLISRVAERIPLIDRLGYILLATATRA